MTKKVEIVFGITLYFFFLIGLGFFVSNVYFQSFFYLPLLFFLSVFPPSDFFPFVILMFGLVFDSLVGQPLGLTSLEWLGLLCAVMRQRKILDHGGFKYQWVGFIFFVIAHEILRHGHLFFLGIEHMTSDGMVRALIGMMPTFLSYPFLIWPLSFLSWQHKFRRI